MLRSSCQKLNPGIDNPRTYLQLWIMLRPRLCSNWGVAALRPVCSQQESATRSQLLGLWFLNTICDSRKKGTVSKTHKPHTQMQLVPQMVQNGWGSVYSFQKKHIRLPFQVANVIIIIRFRSEVRQGRFHSWMMLSLLLSRQNDDYVRYKSEDRLESSSEVRLGSILGVLMLC